MAKDKEQVDRLTEIIESAGLEVRHYSGRGMNDAECLGYTTRPNTEYDAIADLVDATQGDLELVEELSEALRGARTDSLGMGIIVYFPHYIVESEDEDDLPVCENCANVLTIHDQIATDGQSLLCRKCESDCDFCEHFLEINETCGHCGREK